MSVRTIQAGSTDVSVTIRIVDAADGTPEQAVEHNSAGISLWYRREGAALATITPVALASLAAAHIDGGIEHIDDGWYRLDLPDAALADGVAGVQIGGTVTGMVVLAPYVELVDYNPYDGVRLGLTALPNASTDAPGGLSMTNINAEVDTALTDIHLDHLLAADYDPAVKPGVATALLNELIENDLGVPRFTVNALEQAPAGGGGGSGDWTTGEREQIRQALGLTGTKAATAGGNLDGVKAKTDVLTFVGSDVQATLDGEAVTVGTNNDKSGYALSGSKQTLDALNDISAGDILTTALSESYAADGAAPTLSQAVLAIQQFLQERSVNGATVTVRQLDGTNTAMTFTMDSDSAPTSISRAT